MHNAKNVAANIFETRPLYLQVHGRLLGFLTDATWKPGQMIPNEIELARDFGVSVGTMRKALQTLTDQGLLVRRQGRGTFVAQAQALDAAPLDNVRNARDEPLQWQLQSSQLDAAVATDHELSALELSEGERVFRLQRVLRNSATTSTMLEHCVLPEKRFAGLDSDSEAHKLPVGQLGRRYGILVGPGAEHVEMHIADTREAALLDVTRGDALLKLVRIARSLDGVPVEFRVAFCNLRMGSTYLNRIR
ncbi:MAG: GntR family transcriptional regulator [Hyphomicrobiaceae bacterium]|jgi:GntR family transcriptional regulator|nr:GntR family transcriptional regulator [Hyphomicrobiaceae bacterium]